jgi:hypothetical protein
MFRQNLIDRQTAEIAREMREQDAIVRRERAAKRKRAGDNFSGNRLFNTPVTKEVFEAGALPVRSQNSLRRADIPHAVLRKGLPR